MLEVFSADSNARLTERDLYVPVTTAALIIVSGTVGSGRDVVASALSFQAPICRDWQASLVFDRSAAGLAGMSIVVSMDGPDRTKQSWYMGELGWGCDPVVQLDAIVDLLQSGAQVIAYVTAMDPMARISAIFENCDRKKYVLFDQLIRARGHRIVQVTQPVRGGEVYVKVVDPGNRTLRLAVDNTAI